MVSELFIKKLEKMLKDGKLPKDKTLNVIDEKGKITSIRYEEIPRLLRDPSDERGKFLREMIDTVSLGILITEGKLSEVFGD